MRLPAPATLLLGVAALAVAGSTPAHAQARPSFDKGYDPEEPPARAPEAPVMQAEPEPEAQASAGRRRWYGWQVLGLEVGSVALIAALGSSGDGEGGGAALLGGVGLVTTFGSGAVVHLAHGHGERALGSLGLRTGLPLAGALGGYLLFANPDPNGDEQGLVGAVLGAMAGYVGAVVIDVAYLSYDEAPRAPGLAAGIVPRLVLAPDRVGLALGGTF